MVLINTAIFNDIPAGTVVMDMDFPMAEARIIDRPNRFLVVAHNGKEEIRCHLHDPGRLRELIYPGNTVLIRQQAGAKTGYSVTAARAGSQWVITDTRFHHPIARHFLPDGGVPAHCSASMSARISWKNTLASCGPGDASGWYCTEKTWRSRCFIFSTVPSFISL